LSKRVALAGAGIGGLCSALALAKRGFKVSVFEQATKIAEVGAGLQLSPNALHVLNELGVTPLLQQQAFRPQKAVMRHYQHGKPYFSVPLGKSCEQRFGAEYWHVHRADLHQALYQACVDNQVSITLASQVESYQHHKDNVSLKFANQQQLDTDILIGADGIHSKVQATLLANLSLTSIPKFTGQVAWRGTVKTKDLPPNLVEPNANLWVGPGKHFVSYYVSGGEEINFVAVEERSDWCEESWSHQGDITQLRELFSDWHPQVREILAAAQQCFVWALHDREPLTSWVDKNVALIGDACHPMLPFLAQGAAMAIEDAYVLAAMLSQHSDTQTALNHYQNARLPRTAQIQLNARQNASLYHMKSGLDRTKLALLAGLSASGVSDWLAAKKLDSLYVYNAVELMK
jgi:salicylate hydroxylase